MEPVWSVGLMTGTVLDGNIDVALLRTDGETVTEFGPYSLMPYAAETRDLLEQCLAEARDWNFASEEPEIFAKAEEVITRAQSEAVLHLIKEAGLSPTDIGAIGFHGQTVLHRTATPGRNGATRQLGDGAKMHEITGIPVVWDFRSADVAAGGQGAPLAAAYHAALLAQAGHNGDAAILNLGGVANVTWSDGQGGLVAFDTGPANAPINDWINRHTGAEMDRDGELAGKGMVDEVRLGELLQHPYLSAPSPKSLDRFDFGAEMAEGLSLEDGAATLTAFSAAAVGRGLDLLPRRPSVLYVSGGGRHNPILMRELEARAGVRAEPAEKLGWRGDAVEAECFAFLAVRSLRGLPISFPSTTGVPEPMTGGRHASA